MIVNENRSYNVELRKELSEEIIRFDVSLRNIGKEKAEKIIGELEAAKERVKEILAG